MKRRFPHLKMNPIIVKEIRSRMRGPRAFITLTIMLLVMAGIMAAMLQIIMATSRYSAVLSPQIGQAMFVALAFLTLFMVCAITPAVTSGAISGEKEKQTYEMLMATPLSPIRILWGKLISAMSYVLLLLFASVPLASLVFLFGGVAPMQMLKALIVLLAVATTVGILGILMSTLFGRTGRATVASFISVVALLVGPLFLALLIGVLKETEPPRWLLAPSPISALASALAPSASSNSGLDVLWVLGGIWNLGSTPISQVSIPRPIYHYSLPFFMGISMVMLIFATHLLQPARRWRIGRKEVLLSLGAVVAFIVLVGAAFLLTANRYEWAVSSQGLAPTLEPMMAGPAYPAPQGQPQKERVVRAYPVLEPTKADSPSLQQNVISEPLDEKTQAEIYTAVVRQMVEVDHTFDDQAPNFRSIYLVQQTDDAIGDPNIPQGKSVILDALVQSKISDNLTGMDADIIWVAKSQDVPLDEKSGAVLGSGVIVHLGNIHLQSDGSVQVSASIYIASLVGSGKTYILSQQNGSWMVTGTTGVEWIS